jgi:5'-nucleotidase
MSPPLIFVTNDDGINADGLNELARVASAVGNCIVVAPEKEMSGVSHALTLSTQIRVKTLGSGSFAVAGTPVDCVLLGMESLLTERPACLLSGINHGLNLGRDTSYSGTVAAALEGACLGLPSIAFSCTGKKSLPLPPDAFHYLTGLVRNVIETGLPSGVCLNVNVPARKIRGLRLARLEFRGMEVRVKEEPNPEAGTSMRFVGENSGERPQILGSDAAAMEAGYISVTPIRVDRTALDLWETIEPLIDSLEGPE